MAWLTQKVNIYEDNIKNIFDYSFFQLWLIILRLWGIDNDNTEIIFRKFTPSPPIGSEFTNKLNKVMTPFLIYLIGAQQGARRAPPTMGLKAP